jgi:hypothetical protein
MNQNVIIKMIKNSIFFTLLLLLPIFIYGKSDSKEKKEKYLIWLYTVSKHCKYYGILYTVNDSSISILNKNRKTRYYEKMQTLAIDSIKLIKIRKKGNKSVGLLNGGIMSCAIATGLAAAMTQDGKGQPAVVGSSIYVIGLGCLSGFLIGCKKSTIYLNCDVEEYRKYKKWLEKLAIQDY